MSLDARSHGETSTKNPAMALNDTNLDFSLSTLSQDLLDVIHLTQAMLAWPELPGIVLIGHSLGGAVITDLVASEKLGNAVLAYAVLDVVEGKAQCL